MAVIEVTARGLVLKEIAAGLSLDAVRKATAADLILEQRWDEVFVIPDILCNAGGVIVSYFEWVQGLQSFLWTESEVTDKLFRILEHSFAQVIRRAKEHKVSHRTAAMAIGVERVIKAKQVRGLFP